MSKLSRETGWHLVELGELAECLRDEDTTSTVVLGVLWRLIDEVERLNYEVAELNAMRR